MHVCINKKASTRTYHKNIVKPLQTLSIGWVVWWVTYSAGLKLEIVSTRPYGGVSKSTWYSPFSLFLFCSNQYDLRSSLYDSTLEVLNMLQTVLLRCILKKLYSIDKIRYMPEVKYHTQKHGMLL